MEKQLDQEQIRALFDFVNRKRVRYYDLQVELVDHFASAIEDIWRKEPNLPFDSAVNRVYSQFPITGFASLIDKQRKAIQKEAWRWIFQTWRNYFGWPKLLLAIAVIFALRLVFYLPIPANWIFVSSFFLVMGGGLWTLYFSKRGLKKGGKQFLKLEATYDAISHFLNAVNAAFYVLMFGQLEAFPNWAAWLSAIFFTYAGFLMYILLFQLPKRAHAELNRHFPQYA
ncbi:MAG: hypothetical protein R2824_26370 [Saprospiraceae bacterium]|nr:hypothetical protein [Lewinella sp.]